MFPPLCFVDVSTGIVPDSSKQMLQSNMDSEEYKIISDNEDSELNFKFKLVEFFNNINLELAHK